MDSHSLFKVLNDIVINNRKTVIEFGSGFSTVLTGRLLKKNGIDAKVFSVENSRGWMETVQKLLAAEGLTANTELVHAPLQPVTWVQDNTLSWYATDIYLKWLL